MIPQLDLDILLNQAAQGVRDSSEVATTLAAFTDDEKRSALRRASALVGQAGGRESDVPDAITQSGVRRTRTSAVLLTKGRLGIQLARLSTLPNADLDDAIKLVIALLAIADRRRRETRCAQGCTHWWHKDLRDEAFLERLRSGKIV